uniref:Uncharacterized protein n=1 Tax=Anguilla anguilla TaxID=7936 RepID=A0A0E9TYC4_ANGAN
MCLRNKHSTFHHRNPMRLCMRSKVTMGTCEGGQSLLDLFPG